MNKFAFGGFETEIDVTDVEFAEKYEAAAEQYNKDIAKVPKDGKASEQMRYICDVFFKAFDSIFGEGTSEKMFGGKMSVDLCMRAFKDLVDVMRDYSKTFEALEDTLPNRAARRAAERGRVKK